ncbi:hypothetical protein O181_046928 [Austropuccinia psidii MF-1]|uniref:Uncharacterized protein n=1 Tax=Austropuccinia psidii MF-1 TaxID=1389203 RepID=A0A9Q3DT93_9BASI|nr:hypothetical protein [Austropuccinia psidii MF-1]
MDQIILDTTLPSSPSPPSPSNFISNSINQNHQQVQNQIQNQSQNQIIHSFQNLNSNLDIESSHHLQVHSDHDPSSFPGRPPGLHPLAIPPLTLKQKLYIILPQMLGAAVLDGLANFGIGCAMYLNAKNVRIWILKNNTVAGDMAITIFIQGVLTFCIASGMVHVDLRKNTITAFPYPWPDTSWGAAKRLSPDNAKTRIGKLWTTFHNDQGFSRGLHFFSGSDVNDIFDRRLSRSQFFTRLAWSIWKGSVLSVIYFFIIWPIAIAIVSPIWAGENLGNGNFTAPLIKGVYGFVYGLLMNPVCAMIAMGSEDSVRHHRAERQRQQFENPEKVAMRTTAAERVSMPVIPTIELSTPQADNLIEENMSPRSHLNENPLQRVESLRRSLELLSAHPNNLVNPQPDHDQPTPHDNYPGLGWRSSDVYRRRSIDVAPHRISQGRYSIKSTSGPLTRSTSTGSAHPRSTNESQGLFVSPRKLSHLPTNLSHHQRLNTSSSHRRQFSQQGIIPE